MTEEEYLQKEWAKHPQIPPEARKRIEDNYRKAFGIDGKALAEQIEVFVESQDIYSSYGLTDKNNVEASSTRYEKSLLRSVRLVRFIHNTIATKRLNPAHIDWGVVWSEYGKAHPKTQMKSAAVLKATYGRAIRDPKVKVRLFDREFSEFGEEVQRIIVVEENPDVAQLTIKAALYDIGREYGEVCLSGTIIATLAKKGLSLDSSVGDDNRPSGPRPGD